MVIRPARESDIPAIVDLLRKSLGEDNTLKSVEYWKWKHIDNPFGNSPVLLGFEGPTLVGVRAFMRWRWSAGDLIYEAVRAVDTATHPDFRGRGIFNKLTLSLLKECEQNAWSFVFNTPNKLSKPGYLKMGWIEAGKLAVDIKLARPFSIAFNLLGRKQGFSRSVNDDDNSVEMYLNNPQVTELINSNKAFYKSHLITAHTSSSLSWRYHDVAVAKYFASAVENGDSLEALFFYRLKVSRVGTELRVTDIFMRDEESKGKIIELINQRIRHHKADYATVSAINPCFKGPMFSFKQLRIGPMVTVKNINGRELPLLENFASWNPSIGDMELF